MEDKKISIIIPVYNTKDYVRRSIMSVLNQTYTNIEVIVVDDGSDLETIEELKEIQEMCSDDRLRVIYSGHKGCATARNIGLREATGKLIFWLDSDDTLSCDALEITHRVMEQENADIVRIDFTTEKLGIVTMDQQAYMRLLLDDHLKSYLTASLMKRQALNGVHFPEGNLIEDYAIYPQICLNCRKATLLRRKDLYIYTVNRIGSLTESTANKLAGLVPRMNLAEQRYMMFKSRYPEECKCVLAQFTNYACMVYLMYLQNDDERYKKDAENARKLLKEHIGEIRNSEHISKSRKLEARLICNGSIMCEGLAFAHKVKRKVLGIKQ